MDDCIGDRIRQARRAKSITLETLSRRTGLTTGYLSKIERNLNNPPIATISRIATALGVKITDFFEDPFERQRLSIVGPDERKSVTRDGSLFGYYYQALAHKVNDKTMEPFLITLIPHPTDTTFFTHEGEEMMFVLEGEMEFSYGEEKIYRWGRNLPVFRRLYASPGTIGLRPRRPRFSS